MPPYPPRAAGPSDPLGALRRMQEEVNRVLGEYRGGEYRGGEYRGASAPEFPPVNLYRGDDELVLTAELPGVPLADVEITLNQNTLIIKGRREPAVAAANVTHHRKEREYGAFARSIALPYAVDPDRVQAQARNGVVIVRLPRPESEKPRRIQITVG